MDIGAVVLGILCIAAVSIGIYFLTKPKATTPDKPTPSHICMNCRSVIVANVHSQGSRGLELVLWIFFPVPGLIYSVWRNSGSYLFCPTCNARHPVLLDTPAGKVLSTL